MSIAPPPASLRSMSPMDSKTNSLIAAAGNNGGGSAATATAAAAAVAAAVAATGGGAGTGDTIGGGGFGRVTPLNFSTRRNSPPSSVLLPPSMFSPMSSSAAAAAAVGIANMTMASSASALANVSPLGDGTVVGGGVGSIGSLTSGGGGLSLHHHHQHHHQHHNPYPLLGHHPSSRNDHKDSHFLSPELAFSRNAATSAALQRIKQQQQQKQPQQQPPPQLKNPLGNVFGDPRLPFPAGGLNNPIGVGNPSMASLLDMPPRPFTLSGPLHVSPHSLSAPSSVVSQMTSKQQQQPSLSSSSSLHLQAQQQQSSHQHQPQQQQQQQQQQHPPQQQQQQPPPQQGTSRKKQSTRDPLSHRMIEKRRRDRMNNCLTDLSRLIPNSFIKKSSSLQNRGRIEKTEIIEMAIKYLKYLQSMTEPFLPEELQMGHPGSPNSSSGDSQCDSLMLVCKSHSVDAPKMLITNRQQYFRLGYQEAITDIVRFFEDNALENFMGKMVDYMQDQLEKGALAIVKKYVVNGEDMLVPVNGEATQPQPAASQSPFTFDSMEATTSACLNALNKDLMMSGNAPQVPLPVNGSATTLSQTMTTTTTTTTTSPKSSSAQSTNAEVVSSLNSIKDMLDKTITPPGSGPASTAPSSNGTSEATSSGKSSPSTSSDKSKTPEPSTGNNSNDNNNNNNETTNNNNNSTDASAEKSSTKSPSGERYHFKKEIKTRFEKLDVFVDEKLSPGLWLSGSFNSEMNEESIRTLLNHETLHELMNRFLGGLDALAESFSWAKNYFSENKAEDTKFAEPYYVPVFALHPSKEYYIPLRIDSTILGLDEIVKTPEEEPQLVPLNLKGTKRSSEDDKEASTGESIAQAGVKKIKVTDDPSEKTKMKEGAIIVDDKINVKMNGDDSLFPVNIMVNLAQNRTISLTSLFLTLHDWFANELDRVSRKKANTPPTEEDKDKDKEDKVKENTKTSVDEGEANLATENGTESTGQEKTNNTTATEAEGEKKSTESPWLTEARLKTSKKPMTPEIDLSTANWKTLSDLAKAAVLINHEMTSGEGPPKLETATKMLSMIASAASVLDIEFIKKINKEQAAPAEQVNQTQRNDTAVTSNVVPTMDIVTNNPVPSNPVSAAIMRATLPSPPMSLPYHHQALPKVLKEEPNTTTTTTTNHFSPYASGSIAANNHLLSMLPALSSRPTGGITNGMPTLSRLYGSPTGPLLHAPNAVCTSASCPNPGCGTGLGGGIDRTSQLANRSVQPPAAGGGLYPYNLVAQNELILRGMNNGSSEMFSPSSGSASSQAHSPLAHSRGHSPGQSLGHSPGQPRGLSPAAHQSLPPFTSPGLQHHFASQLYQKWPGAQPTATTSTGALVTPAHGLVHAQQHTPHFPGLDLAAIANHHHHHNPAANGFVSPPSVVLPTTSSSNGAASHPLWASNPLMMSLFGNATAAPSSEPTEPIPQQQQPLQVNPEIFKDQLERFHYMFDNVGELAAAAAARGHQLPGMPQLYPPTSTTTTTTANEPNVNLLNRRPDSRVMSLLSAGRAIQTPERFVSTNNRLAATSTPGHTMPAHDRPMSSSSRLLPTPGQNILSPGGASTAGAANERPRLPSTSNTPINLSKESNKLITHA